jgi:hypothetical protein
MKRELKESLIFFGLVLGLTFFVFWGPIALFKIPTVNLVQGGRGPIWAIILFVIGGFVPSLTGIYLTYYYEGKTGLKNMFKNAIKIKMGFKLYFLVIIVNIYLSLSLILLNNILGNSFDFSQFLLQLPMLAPLIILGPLSEEFGWRGFAIKRLLKVLSPNQTSLLIGLAWSFWHLPLFHIVGSSQYEFNIPFSVFLITVTASSFIYTYLYIKSAGSIFSAIFFHWIYTYMIQVVNSTIDRSLLYNRLEFIPSLIAAIVFAVLLKRIREEDINALITD